MTTRRMGLSKALRLGLITAACASLFATGVQAQNRYPEKPVRVLVGLGAGGGTVGVIQAYVADATKPEDRSKALGWLSAATNAGVAIGPAIGSWAMKIGTSGPGLVAAAITLTNMGFAWKFLTESNELAGKKSGERPVPRKSRDAVRRVVSHSGEPASRLIWIYGITMGSFQGMNTILALFLSWRFGVTEKTIGYFFMYVGTISFVTRAAFLGKMVDKFGEPRLSRIGMVCLAAGLGGMAAAPTIPLLAAAILERDRG